MKIIDTVQIIKDKEKELFYKIINYKNNTFDIRFYNLNKKYLYKIVNINININNERDHMD